MNGTLAHTYTDTVFTINYMHGCLGMARTKRGRGGGKEGRQVGGFQSRTAVRTRRKLL